MSDFYPISPLIGITNTSYAAQAGIMDDKWAIRVVRGKKVIAEKTMRNLDIESIVGIIYGHARIEGLSRHSVAMTAGRLMQFARRYQQSGVCPNFEVPDLVHMDGSTGAVAEPQTSTHDTGATESATGGTAPQGGGVQVEEQPALAKLGRAPQLGDHSLKDLWRGCVEARSHAILGAATYAAELPEGHIEAMFDYIADNLVRDWSASGDSEQVIRRFALLIQSCSEDSQIPVTKGQVTIENGACALMKKAQEMQSQGYQIPRGYPCKFHEAVAAKVSSITGVDILINASSTGCRVTFRVE